MIPNEENEGFDLKGFGLFILKILLLLVFTIGVFLLGFKFASDNCEYLIKKEQVIELCGRSNVIPNPTKYKGRLLEKPTLKHIEKKYYEYETGFPLTGNSYKIKPKF